VSLTTSDGGLPITRGGVGEEYRYESSGQAGAVRGGFPGDRGPGTRYGGRAAA
jgi:hypothetical protein